MRRSAGELRLHEKRAHGTSKSCLPTWPESLPDAVPSPTPRLERPMALGSIS